MTVWVLEGRLTLLDSGFEQEQRLAGRLRQLTALQFEQARGVRVSRALAWGLMRCESEQGLHVRRGRGCEQDRCPAGRLRHWTALRSWASE